MENPLHGDDSGGDLAAATNENRGSKRSFSDVEEEGDDIVGSKKCCRKVDEEATLVILSLKASLEKYKDDLASCQSELETAETEIQEWKSAFKKESFIPANESPEPRFVIDYIETLKSTEKSMNEQLEIAQMKLAICDLKSQLKKSKAEESLDHTDDESIQALLDELKEAKATIVYLEERHATQLVEVKQTIAEESKKLAEDSKKMAEHIKKMEDLHTVMASMVQ
ncbi:unnamed protein product [Cochlearia groenlandica]